MTREFGRRLRSLLFWISPNRTPPSCTGRCQFFLFPNFGYYFNFFCFFYKFYDVKQKRNTAVWKCYVMQRIFFIKCQRYINSVRGRVRVCVLERFQWHKRTREKFWGKYWQEVPVPRLCAIRLFSLIVSFFPHTTIARKLEFKKTQTTCEVPALYNSQSDFWLSYRISFVILLFNYNKILHIILLIAWRWQRDSGWHLWLLDCRNFPFLIIGTYVLWFVFFLVVDILSLNYL